ncbi:MAG: hypothetical protein O2958_12290 [Gemmatimonadetes bacterium]|nr:hypothetical protein [Gemmatimonadota bacterium]MDA1102993.1 hypothetical protein [Gemmatimonadota bacterium]
MTLVTLRTLRYARAWLSESAEVVQDEILLDRDGTTVPATLVRPRKSSGPLPAWIVMHGITRQGRAHDQLVRFTRSVAATGTVTIVPEVPEWRALDLAPHLSAPTIKAAIAGLRSSGAARDERVGVIGFSFGAPHAIASSGDPTLRDDIAGTAGFGGYCHLESMFRFMMTGRHSWRGEEHVLEPDPYARWIAAANYLTAIPDHEDAGDVASALRELAVQAGNSGSPSWHAIHDVIIVKLREGVAESRRTLFDLFAPLSTTRSNGTKVGADAPSVAEGLSEAGRRIDPMIDPREALGAVDRPVHILHGRTDRLMPFTEGYRLHSAMPRSTRTQLTITRLFGHSGQDPFPFARTLSEVPRLARGMSGLLGVV